MTTQRFSCEEFRIAAMALADGEAAPLDHEQVKQHVATCDNCRVELQRMDIQESFDASTQRAPQSADVWQRVRNQLAPEATVTEEQSAQTLDVSAVEDRDFMLLHLVDELPARHREVIRMRHLDRWPLAMIAEELHESQAEVAEQLVAAAQILHAKLGSRLPSGGSPSPVEPTLESHASHVTIETANTLVNYLQRTDSGETVDRSSVSDREGQIAAYFDIADRLEKASGTLGQTLQGELGDMSNLETLAPQDTVREKRRGPVPALRAFGDYELIEQIAKGGMGVVYKARQPKLKRTVALKMILAGQFANEQEIARFHTEAEAAANLRHPNIVSVYEVGEVDGQHYFSMEYVDGPSLAEAVRRDSVSPQRAAEIMRTIAEAIQFAHDKGILHRDLKPANVMLDPDGKPLVTDFGLAKRIEDSSGITITGAIVGTPSYMPPEQADPSTGKVGPTSDLYSLGAVLYELLTGRPPFRASNPFETVKKVIEEEAPLPRTIDPSIPRDLETICMKCLQKERERRYGSARELAEELKRYLNGEPIQARPISSGERVIRWCRRNPKVATWIGVAVSAMIVALIASFSAFMVQSWALEEVRAAKLESDESYRKAREAVDEWFTQISEYDLLNEPALQPLRRDLLERALDYYGDFLRQRGGDPTLRDEIALTHFRIGVIQQAAGTTEEALAALQRARDMQQALLTETPNDNDRKYALSNTITAMGTSLAHAHRDSDALDTYDEALALRQELVKAAPDNIEYQRKLANAEMNIGIVFKDQTRWDEGRGKLNTAQDVRTMALAKDEKNDRLRRDFGKGFFNLAKLEFEARLEALSQADGVGAETLRKKSLELAEKARAEFERLYENDPKSFLNRIQLATCNNLLAELKALTADEAEADMAEAIQLYDSAQPVLHALTLMNPAVAEYQAELATLNLQLGRLQMRDQQAANARRSLQAAEALFAELVKQNPNVPGYRGDLATTQRTLASVEALAYKRFEEAEALMNKAIANYEMLVQAHPENETFVQFRDETKPMLDELKTLKNDSQPQP